MRGYYGIDVHIAEEDENWNCNNPVKGDLAGEV